MPTTNFSSGTVVTSTWLNEIDQLRFDADGSQYLKHTAVGTNASSRDLNDVLDDITYVSTNYASLQDAVTAASGKVLKIVGSYSLGSTTISVPANTWLDARGASLTWTGNVTGLDFAGGGGIIGGTLTGAGGGTYNANGIAIRVTGTAGAGGGDSPTYVNGITVEGTTITGWAHAGVWLGYARNIYIKKCNISTIGYVGIGGVSCEDVWIVENEIDTVAGSGAPDTYGIFVDRSEGTETQNPRSRYVYIIKNKVFNVTNWEAIDTHAGEDFIIAFNLIKGCRYGIMLVVSDISGTPSLACRRCTVFKNIIQGSSTGACITVQGVSVQKAKDILVDGNICLNGGWTNDTSEGAIRVYQVLNISIVNNILRTPYVWGINLNGDVSDGLISGNTIVDVRDTTQTTPACIRVNASNITALMTNNTFKFEDSGADTYVAVHSVSSAGSLTGLDIRLGPSIFNGITSSKLTLLLGTSTGVNKTGFYEESGNASLSAGSVNITFTKRFPSVPNAQVTMGSDLNPVRISAISETGMTVTGTGTTTIYWRAST